MTVQIGDRIRLLHVPAADLQDRARLSSDPDWIPTATVLEHLIATDPIVVIESIDEYGHPWFRAQFRMNGEEQDHSIALMDNTSWELLSSQ